jgi:transposase-like protein
MLSGYIYRCADTMSQQVKNQSITKKRDSRKGNMVYELKTNVECPYCANNKVKSLARHYTLSGMKRRFQCKSCYKTFTISVEETAALEKELLEAKRLKQPLEVKEE